MKTIVTGNENRLTKDEKRVVKLFGELYIKRGQPGGLGEIYALLYLKANSLENGLDQKEIASMIGRSVSTTSKLLKQLVEMRFCNFVEELNEFKKRERKYFMTISIKEIAINRFYKIIEDNINLKNELGMIKRSIPEEELNITGSLIQRLLLLEKQIDELNEFYKEAIELSKTLFSDLDG